jgi:hypothetical protein
MGNPSWRKKILAKSRNWQTKRNCRENHTMRLRFRLCGDKLLGSRMG